MSPEENKVKFLVTIMLLMSLVWISGCSEQPSDEVQIQEKMAQLQEAIEKKDRSGFMAEIDEQYQDQLGNNRKALQRMLMGFFLRYKDISIFVSGSEIEVTQIRAEGRSQVVVTGGEGIIPDNARHYQVYSCWNKHGGEWLLSCLEWE